MNSRLIKPAYLISAFFLFITGFGQMPIYKRYYVADIPGFGWMANFYITHLLHYLFASVLMGIGTYVLVNYLLRYRRTYSLSKSGYLRGLLLFGIITTGTILVLFNLPGVFFSQELVIFLVLAHLGLSIVFLLTSLISLIFKHNWFRQVSGNSPDIN